MSDRRAGPVDLVDAAVELASAWLAASGADHAGGARAAARLGALVADPDGLTLALHVVDRVIRPEDRRVAAGELAALAGRARTATFLSPVDRGLLAVGARLATTLPSLVVPAARARLRGLVGHLVADAGPGLTRRLARARSTGFPLVLNVVGEAVLGEAEADRRLAALMDLVARPDVDAVAVKASALASQLPPWDTAAGAEQLLGRLRPLVTAAAAGGTGVVLDMEEYRDLGLTLEAFTRLARDRSLGQARIGIALQAYLPEAVDALDEVTSLARLRVADGGRPVTVRLVKGANLAMERVEAQLRGWLAAPLASKAEVDAQYVRLLDRAIDPDRTAVVRVAVAGHNLYHLALAHLLAQDRGVGARVHVEMLQGMSPVHARAVRDTLRDAGAASQAELPGDGPVRLYTPVVDRRDLDAAIAYLVRRLDEAAAPQNFLHAMATASPTALADQRDAFRTSVQDASRPAPARRRGADPAARGAVDTDPALAAAQTWAAAVLAAPVAGPTPTTLRTPAQVDAVVAAAVAAAPGWAGTAPSARAEVLRRAGALLEAARGDLVAVMAHEAGKPVAEADPEVSEAVDFARYYARCAQQLAGSTGGATFHPSGVSVVTPPWNFPVAIPVGSALAALAAGSPVLVKPAPATPVCAEVALAAVQQALAEAGAPHGTLQVVRCAEGELGRRLVAHPDVSRVLLTGSIETARLFARWRPELDVVAETSGKNAVVVTPAADVDLAVADVVRSAFGHAGQKCSAASLLILVGAAGRSARLRRQLVDAVTSLHVDVATCRSAAVGPLVAPAAGALLDALTRLDPGEHWWVEPRRLDDAGRLWRPGVKDGVRPGSWFHRTEVFGPVLGVITVATLDEAIAVQNAVAFGLTGGLHSLDEGEIASWLDRVEVGNAYVNRSITGAIVERQPFGGWKASVVGPGAKAGGPDYVAQLGTWRDPPKVPTGDGWLAWALADDLRVWQHDLGRAVDTGGLDAEQNVLRHLPVPHLWVRAGADARPAHVARVLAAARLVGTPVTVSRAGDTGDDELAAAVRSGRVTGRVRVVGTAPGLRAAAAGRDVTVLDGPVLASARRELLTVLREQTVSRTLHRFGQLDPAVAARAAASAPGGAQRATARV